MQQVLYREPIKAVCLLQVVVLLNNTPITEYTFSAGVLKTT